MASSVTLRRGALARARTIRVHELAAWVAIVVGAVEVVAGSGSGVVVAVLLGVLGVAVRVAIATEWVRCDSAGIAWRSTFVTFRVGWDEITSMEIAARPMRIWLLRGRTFFTVPCLELDRGAKKPPLFVTPSVWTSMTRQAEFIAAARLLSPQQPW